MDKEFRFIHQAEQEFDELLNDDKGAALLRDLGRSREEGKGIRNYWGIYVTKDDIFSSIMDYRFFGK